MCNFLYHILLILSLNCVQRSIPYSVNTLSKIYAMRCTIFCFWYEKYITVSILYILIDVPFKPFSDNVSLQVLKYEVYIFQRILCRTCIGFVLWKCPDVALLNYSFCLLEITVSSTHTEDSLRNVSLWIYNIQPEHLGKERFRLSKKKFFRHTHAPSFPFLVL
jgi:hypothetical protein